MAETACQHRDVTVSRDRDHVCGDCLTMLLGCLPGFNDGEESVPDGDRWRSATAQLLWVAGEL